MELDKITAMFYLGANANKALINELLAINTSIRFISSHIYPEASQLDSNDLFKKLFIDFDEDISGDCNQLQFTSTNGYNYISLIEEIMDDKLLPLLWMRFRKGLKDKNRNEIKRYEVIYSLIKLSIETCLTQRPEVIIFSYEPHMLPIYIFKKVSKALGIKSYTLTISPFVWRMYCEGLSEEYLKSPSTLRYVNSHKLGNGNKGLEKSVKRFIIEKSGDYKLGKPFYEKRDFNKNPLKSSLAILKVNGWNWKKFVLSNITRSFYESITTSRLYLQKLKYVSFFLQYQPEQTTLPDGKLFVNQLFAIQALYSVLEPLGISLVIREHPATFQATFDPHWRSKGFYRSIQSISSNIYFDNLNEAPFSLIENSLAVASITGTVLVESLIRGKPVIAFGKSPLDMLSSIGCINSFKNETDLCNQLKSAIRLSPEDIINDITNYLYGIYDFTFGDDEYCGNENMTLELLRGARYNALIQVFKIINEKTL